jgi:hypothetical protein
VLGVGLDWAEDYHDVALGVPGKGVIEQFRVEHGPAGVQRLVTRCLAPHRKPDPHPQTGGMRLTEDVSSPPPPLRVGAAASRPR